MTVPLLYIQANNLKKRLCISLGHRYTLSMACPVLVCDLPEVIPTIFSIELLCLNGTLSWVDFMDVIIGDVPPVSECVQT